MPPDLGIHNPNAVDDEDLLFSPIIRAQHAAAVSRVEQVLQQHNPAAIDEARAQMRDALDELDSNLLF